MNLQRIKELIQQDKLVKFYQCKAWRDLRLDALDRDNNECQECKRQGKVTTNKQIKDDDEDDNKPVKLEVHHIKEVKKYPELALVLDNLKTVCVDCHNKEHGRVFGQNKRKKRWDDERW
jgi:5-methylcytosine-specific restriction enzyme A